MSVDVKKFESLNNDGKEELALALYLWQVFKRQGKMDVQIMKQVYYFVDMLDIRKQYDKIDKMILEPIEIKIK